MNSGISPLLRNIISLKITMAKETHKIKDKMHTYIIILQPKDGPITNNSARVRAGISQSV
jgi:hypothetical protein